MRKFVLHRNKWWWGHTTNIIEGNGYGEVEIQFDSSWINVAYIRGLSVFDSERKKGLGTKLMCNAICEAKSSGMKFVKLDVEKEKEWLVAWYERLGFTSTNEDEHTYSMIKVL